MPKSELTLDQLRDVSLALKNLLEQDRAIEAEAEPDRHKIAALTGDDGGPVAYDLTAIWRASLEDPDCYHISQGKDKRSPRARRYMSPRRYVNTWPNWAGAVIETDEGRFLADRNTAFDYCQRADARVMGATIDHMIAKRKEHARRDPIGNAVASAEGGGFAMMFARVDARHLGLSDEEFDEAVLERAKGQAATMGEYAAEKFLSLVRQALEGCPKIQVIERGQP